MRKRSEGRTGHRAAPTAGAVVLLCVFLAIPPFLDLPVSARMNHLIPVSNTTLNTLMSDWVAIPLSRMIGTAELILCGNVTSVRDSSYVFRISRRLSGICEGDTIEVLKVIPDRFASTKPAPYARGQCFLIFLIRANSNQRDSRWKVMGIGGEGQMPVINNYVYFVGNNITGIEFANYDVNGTEQYVQRFEFVPFVNAVEEYRKCFRWTKTKTDKQYTPRKICDERTVTEFRQRSFIHSFLINQTNLILDKK